MSTHCKVAFVVSVMAAIFIAISTGCVSAVQVRESDLPPTTVPSELHTPETVPLEPTPTHPQSPPVTSTPVAISATPTLAAVPPPDIAPVGYGYTLESGNDGWAYGQVLLAFTNTSGQLAFAEKMSVELYVETEEGQTYPAVIGSESWPPHSYDTSPSVLDIAYFEGVPPDFTVRRVFRQSVGSGTAYYVIHFRVAEITHPTRIVFPSYPDWTIDLASATTADPGFPGQEVIAQAVPPSGIAGHVFDGVPDQASMFLDGTCLVDTEIYYVLRLNYTIENRDDFHGARFSGNLGPVALASGDGAFYVSDSLAYNIEVGPSQTVHDYFEINTTSVFGDQMYPPILLVLYGPLSNEARGYSIISVDSCLFQ